MKVGLLNIASNKYIQFLQPLMDGGDEFFLPNQEVTYFIFSNKKVALETKREVVTTHVEHREWPWMTLGRYQIFSDNAEIFSEMDYLYYCDVDMRFIGDVGDEILSERVGTAHPGCYLYNPRGDLESNPDSLAYVAPEIQLPHYYLAGGFNGGTTEEYLKMSKALAKNITIDHDNGIIAQWHDESHMNRYFLDTPPTLILDPGYCYGEGHPLPFTPRLLALNKDHAEIRS